MRDSFEDQANISNAIRDMGKHDVKLFTASFISDSFNIPLDVVEKTLSYFDKDNELIQKVYRIENPDNIGEYEYFNNINDIKLNSEHESKITGRTFWVGNDPKIEILYKISDQYLKKLKSKGSDELPKDLFSKKSMKKKDFHDFLEKKNPKIVTQIIINEHKDVKVMNDNHDNIINNGVNNGNVGYNNNNSVYENISVDDVINQINHLYDSIDDTKNKSILSNAKKDLKNHKFRDALTKVQNISIAATAGTQLLNSIHSVINSISNFIK